MTFRTIPKSQSLVLNELSRTLQDEGRKVYKFGFGESPFLPLKRVREALSQSVNRKEYTAVQGLPELRERVAHFHSQADSVHIEPRQIIIGTGSKILLYNTLMAFESAVVLVPSPAWVSYKPQAQLVGHRVHAVPCNYENRWRIQPSDLDAILSLAEYKSLSKILVLNSPGNPDGLTYSSAELEAIINVLRKHDVWVISDEIYALLHHQGKHQSIAQYYPERTFVTTGLSKWCGAGGWRLGVQILPQDAPPALYSTIVGLASETYSCASTPIQAAAIEAYQWDKVTEAYLQNQRQIVAIVGNYVHKQLIECDIAVHPPEGGFYLLLDFSPMQEQLRQRGIETDGELCSALLQETGVALLPGTAFGNSASSLTARLAYVDFDGDAVLEDLENNPASAATILENHCNHLVEGVQAMVDWVN